MSVITPLDMEKLRSGIDISTIAGMILEAFEDAKRLKDFSVKYNLDLSDATLSEDEAREVAYSILPLFEEVYLEKSFESIVTDIIPYLGAALAVGKAKLPGAKVDGDISAQPNAIVVRPIEPKLFGKTNFEVNVGSADTWVDFIGSATSPYTFDTAANGFGAAAIIGVKVLGSYVPAYINAKKWKVDDDKFLLYTGLKIYDDILYLKFPVKRADAIFTEKDQLYIRVKDPATTGTTTLHLIGVVVARASWVKDKIGY